MKRITEDEIQAAIEVLKSQKLSRFFQNFKGGEHVRAFEEKFREFYDVKHAISVCNGTAALHTALLALGCKGGEVITTPYTFVSTATSIIMAGGTPVFVDIEPLTNNIDPEQIEKAITKKTVGILPVHLLGYPCNMYDIMQIAEDHNLWVLEDCAQALGTRYKYAPVGTYGNAAIFSFQDTKQITTGGEGGMIITDDQDIAEKCYNIRNHGEKYNNAMIMGYNYRLTEMQAAIGSVQLEKLLYYNDWQRKNAEYVIKNLPKQIEPPFCSIDAYPTYWILGCKMEAGLRDLFLKECQERKLTEPEPTKTISGGYDRLIYQLPYFQKYYKTRYGFSIYSQKNPCPFAEHALKTALWIDRVRFPNTMEDMFKMIQSFKEILLLSNMWKHKC